MKVLPEELMQEILPERADVTTFKLDKQATKKLVDVLATQLYKDPFESCVRELFFNAVEANLSTGKSVEDVECYIDNKFLIVKDQGPGLSEDDIRKTFCEFFWSTKDEDDNFIGGFGLGAKSPFALTNEFYVDSHYQGEKTSYKIFINHEGIIDYEILDKQETEKTGLVVKVPLPDYHSIRFFNKHLRMFKRQLGLFDDEEQPCITIHGEFYDAYLIPHKYPAVYVMFLGTSYYDYFYDDLPILIVFKPGCPFFKPTASRESCTLIDKDQFNQCVATIKNRICEEFENKYGIDPLTTLMNIESHTVNLMKLIHYDSDEKIVLYVVNDLSVEIKRRRNAKTPKHRHFKVLESDFARIQKFLETFNISYEVYHIKQKQSKRKTRVPRRWLTPNEFRSMMKHTDNELQNTSDDAGRFIESFSLQGFDTKIFVMSRNSSIIDMLRDIKKDHMKLRLIYQKNSPYRQLGFVVFKHALKQLGIKQSELANIIHENLGYYDTHYRTDLATLLLCALDENEIFHHHYYEYKLGLSKDQFIRNVIARYYKS